MFYGDKHAFYLEKYLTIRDFTKKSLRLKNSKQLCSVSIHFDLFLFPSDFGIYLLFPDNDRHLILMGRFF